MSDLRLAHRVDGVRVSSGAGTPLVDGVSFAVRPGSLLGIVGETGAGKTLTVRAALGLLPPGLRAEGSMSLIGHEPVALSDLDALRAHLGRTVSCVLQNPHSMLDPMQRVGRQLREGVVRAGLATTREADERAVTLLRAMGFADPSRVVGLYPHQLSGGMAQRVATALGMMPRPKLLVLDEPTSALDAHVRLDVLALLRAAAAEQETAVLLISHDLGLVSQFCDDLMVLYSGTVVEQGTARSIIDAPRHPYTRALIRCSDTFGRTPRVPMPTITGAPPAPRLRPQGCPYVTRCELAVERCAQERPLLRVIDGGDCAACHRAEEVPASAAPPPPPPPTVVQPAMGTKAAVVEVTEATVEYGRGAARFRALDGVSFALAPGETLAVVGESGAGKSTLVRLLAGFEQPLSGRVQVQGAAPRLKSGVVSPVQVVFQHPLEALSRFASIEESIAEPLHRLQPAERRRRVAALLEDVGLDPRRAGAKPSAFSGGQLQRVVLARALAADPAVLICDEATSALDVSVQAQIANLVMRLQAERGFACVFVTHDLGLGHILADRVLVLKAGQVVELAGADTFFAGPETEYARGLLAATRDHEIAHA